MTSLITIREYEPGDKNDVINLIKLNAPEFFATDEEDDLIKYLLDSIVYEVTKSGETVGVFCLFEIDKNTIELKNIAVVEII